jgi:hypothetical protein
MGKWLLLPLALTALSCEEREPVEIGGGFRVDPSVVIFRHARPRAEPYRQSVTVRNIGTRPVRVTGLVLAGDSAFRLESDLGGAFTLQPQMPVVFSILFQAMDRLPKTALLTIASDYRGGSRMNIPVMSEALSPGIKVTNCVRAAAGAPCVRGNDDLLVTFGEVRPRECPAGEITVENVGEAPLEVEAPVFRPDSSPEFQFFGAPPPSFSLNPPDESGVTDQQILRVKYCPTHCGGGNGALMMASNDPAAPEVLVGLKGASRGNESPICACDPSTLRAAPLETITLSGAGCVDPDGDPLQFSWTVVSRPPGSTSPIQNVSSRDAAFFIDLATPSQTPYVFRVTATDCWGAHGSCEISMFVLPSCTGFGVQLISDREGVDLHLAGPQGDCSAANPSPDWGIVGEATDDPQCTSNRVNYDDPPATLYRLGVQYTCDRGLGAANATVRVYCNSLQVAELGPKLLDATGAFWDVARLQGPGCVVAPVDQMTTVPSGCREP